MTTRNQDLWSENYGPFMEAKNFGDKQGPEHESREGPQVRTYTFKSTPLKSSVVVGGGR